MLWSFAYGCVVVQASARDSNRTLVRMESKCHEFRCRIRQGWLHHPDQSCPFMKKLCVSNTVKCQAGVIVLMIVAGELVVKADVLCWCHH
jgi:hypothetical protein